MRHSVLLALVISLLIETDPIAQKVDLAIPLPSLETVEEVVAQQLQEAIESVRKIASGRDDAPGHAADAYGRLGQLFHAYEFLEAAAVCYENARRLAPRDYRWPHLLAHVREQTGEVEEAVDLYLLALRLEPSDHVAEVRLGYLYLQLNRRGEARTRFESQRERFPASSLAGLGEVALRERRFDDAIRLYEEALRRAPHATSLHYSIGMAFRGLGRVNDAQGHLARVGQGRVRPADSLVDGLPALLRGVQPLLNQARVELQAGAYAAGVEMFRRAIEAAPNLVEESLTIQLALLLADEQRFGDAIALLTTAFERSPDRIGTATTLARLLAAAPDRSLRDGKRALDIAMTVYGRHATAAHAETVALSLAELGRCAEASKWMNDALGHARVVDDQDEVVRLRNEAPRYEREPCR